MITRTAVVGAGGMARKHHLPLMIENGADIRVICEPSSNNYELMLEALEELGVAPPPNEPDLAKLLDQYGTSWTSHSSHRRTICITIKQKCVWKLV